MKYFLLGSFATAFFLYGIALTYGATGTTHLDLVGQAGAQASTTLLKMGLGFVFVGLAFKVAAAPFQLWTPDVYGGAPHRSPRCSRLARSRRIRPGASHSGEC